MRELLCNNREGYSLYSTERDFDSTTCFENFNLITLPSLLFILISISDIWRSLKHPIRTDTNSRLRFGVKIAGYISLNLLLLVQLFDRLDYSIETISQASVQISITLALFLSIIHHNRFNKPSSLLLLFYPTIILSNLIKLRTVIISDYTSINPHLLIPTILILAFIWLVESSGPGYPPSNDPLKDASIYSLCSFSWLTPLLKLGRQRFINEEDLWDLPEKDHSEHVGRKLQNKWHYQTTKSSNKPSLWLALCKAYGKDYLIYASFFKMLQDSLTFVQPQLLKSLLQFVNSQRSDSPEPLIKGYCLAIVMFVSAVSQSTFLHQYFQLVFMTGLRVRAGLVNLLYDKSLHLNNNEKAQRPTGDVVNLMSVDTNRLTDLCTYGHILWSGPFQILLAFISLYNLLGWQSFVGVGVMIVSIPITTVIARYVKKLSLEQMKIKDKRTHVMNELLTNMKSIKLFAWEDSFAQKLLHIRNNEELHILRKIGVVNGISNFVWMLTPFLVSFTTFWVYSVTSKEPLTSDKIFPGLAIFQLLSFPLFMISNIITSTIESAVSVDRLKDFLLAGELDPEAKLQVIPNDINVGEEVVRISHGDFAWSEDAHMPILQDINLSVKMGELVALVGRVGDGKSSMVQAILGEMHKFEGTVNVKGSIAYYGQSPWIMGATVKENILFGHKFDQDFYNLVIESCALRSDLELLPQGDMTEVGEKGITLSGGQKARVALARAVYSRADIYLLDDPLCAVDAHVGRHLWNNVIGHSGILKNKTRIISTNNAGYFDQVDALVMLKRGVILEKDSYLSAIQRQGQLWQLMMKLGKGGGQSTTNSSGTSLNELNNSNGKGTPPTDGENTLVNGELDKQSHTIFVDEQSEGPKVDVVYGVCTEETKPREKRMSMSMRRASVVSLDKAKAIALDAMRNSSQPKEQMGRGNIKTEVYKKYAESSSYWGVIAFLITACLIQVFSVAGSVVLKNWGEANNNGEANGIKYLLEYFACGLLSAIFMFITAFLLWAVCSIKCSKHLHDDMFHAVMRAPLGYFERTPVGVILNRFSRDVQVIDEVLVRVISGFFRTLIVVISIVFVIGGALPPFLLMIIPLSIFYQWIMKLYLSTSREIKRLDAVSRSPVFSWFQESLGGLPTIRAFRQQSRFIASETLRMDRNLMASLPAMSINRWLAMRLEVLGSSVILATALFAVTSVKRFNLDAGLVGLCISYALQITGGLNWFVRCAGEVEQNIVSVERVYELAQLEPEALPIVEDNRPSAEWPDRGSVVFNNFSAKYRPELSPVLKDINLNINPSEKIGVVGRTGAGKSSLTLCLFRILEAFKGEIKIDGIDISTIGLKDLRSRLAIIPQDAQLFDATVRENLDPEAAHSDDEIWRALESTDLSEHITELGGLNSQVAEGGSNLSNGQRQLVAIARALLTNSRILILDEATSAIDSMTDNYIQNTIRKQFKDMTIITIAHRLRTIIDYDKILVLDKGTIGEFDTPYNLLLKKDGIFSSMVKQSGEEDELRSVIGC
ncbi:hypothetical protein E3P89_00354 [Wallemia ichthyophaga]|uniref:Metal resistance protein YCF1 n=1 Tax=Wallemia ichthyophaga TaxID=245174 RepID=A0A4T0HVF7_WALIC|nr:hypothetical protein E3P90_00513 [Wallemia ichthyophaga]TIB18085.1 hypothetical protein E3P93_00370 [Wallemia ichthyophaga]TIB25741.1 hypothetical protein E3P89_00354 [Wallemia ichthyophaga]TIB27111.1 hypothetical protein E3P88_00382 [Wallemia ichthyophaga]